MDTKKEKDYQINIPKNQIIKEDGVKYIPKKIVAEPSDELKKALQEVNEIICGKKEAKGYRNIDELKKALLDD